MGFYLKNGTPALILAPMEGVTDAPMRALLTESGAFSLCVSEFLRISHEVLPARVYTRHLPELETECRTTSGTPVHLQLLGGDPELMALSAARAIELGVTGIDLNFGCPAPTVNRHDGGATLLKYPDRIREIVRAVRDAVPSPIPVSAKLRLGWDCPESVHLNADRAAEGGASWITIHGRTKCQGYTPPAYWEPIGEVRRRLSIPVVANGEIWNREDFLRCQEQTGSEHFMLGRGSLANPNLPRDIARELGIKLPEARPPFVTERPDWPGLLPRFISLTTPRPNLAGYTVRRIKQWLNMAHKRGEFAAFEQIKRLDSVGEILAVVGDYA